MLGQRHENTSRLIARVVRDLLRTTWGTLADLTDALKTRCARLRISVDPDDITDAYRIVGSNAPLVHDGPAAARPDPVEPGSLSHTEACAILAKHGVTVPLRSMPAVRELTPEQRRRRASVEAQVRAFDVIAAELLETDRRIARLETAIDEAIALAQPATEGTAMRTWTRARLRRTCGGCGKPVAHGAPLLEIQLPNVQARKVRGECCEGPAPADLPPLAAPAPAPAPIPLTRVTPTLPLDWRSRAAGDEEDR